MMEISDSYNKIYNIESNNVKSVDRKISLSDKITVKNDVQVTLYENSALDLNASSRNKNNFDNSQLKNVSAEFISIIEPQFNQNLNANLKEDSTHSKLDGWNPVLNKDSNYLNNPKFDDKFNKIKKN